MSDLADCTGVALGPLTIKLRLRGIAHTEASLPLLEVRRQEKYRDHTWGELFILINALHVNVRHSNLTCIANILNLSDPCTIERSMDKLRLYKGTALQQLCGSCFINIMIVDSLLLPHTFVLARLTGGVRDDIGKLGAREQPLLSRILAGPRNANEQHNPRVAYKLAHCLGRLILFDK